MPLPRVLREVPSSVRARQERPIAVRYLGIQSHRSGVILRGTFAGGEDRCAAAQLQVLALVDDAANVREIVDGLMAIASESGMILETGDTGGDVLGFYLWEPVLS